MTIQMKFTEQYFPVVLFIHILYRVVLTFDRVGQRFWVYGIQVIQESYKLSG